MPHDPADVSVDHDYLLGTLTELVRINSVNPTLVPGAPGEREIAEYIGRSMTLAGLRVRLLEPAPGRVSVVATLPGRGGGKSLMLNGHIDTVGIEGMPDPFGAIVRDDRLFGRGAYDMKGAVAACMAAGKALADANVSLRGDVVIAAVADEEYGSLGTESVLEAVQVDGAIVTEPTQLEICLAHKGYSWIEVETEGRAAHGSRFTEGVDANLRMGRFLAQLERLAGRLLRRKPHPLVGPPSLHAAILAGGTGLSTYAAASKVQIERRTVPGETEAGVVRELQRIVDALRRKDPTFAATLRPFFTREPFEVSPDAPIVQALARAARASLGKPPRMVGDTPWMDAALLGTAGVETVVFGPSGGGAHSAEEWVDLDSVRRCAATLVRTALIYCA